MARSALIGNAIDDVCPSSIALAYQWRAGDRHTRSANPSGANSLDALGFSAYALTLSAYAPGSARRLLRMLLLARVRFGRMLFARSFRSRGWVLLVAWRFGSTGLGLLVRGSRLVRWSRLARSVFLARLIVSTAGRTFLRWLRSCPIRRRAVASLVGVCLA